MLEIFAEVYALRSDSGTPCACFDYRVVVHVPVISCSMLLCPFLGVFFAVKDGAGVV